MGLAPFFCRPFLDNGCSKPLCHHLVLLGFRELGQPALSALRRIQMYNLGGELFHIVNCRPKWATHSRVMWATHSRVECAKKIEPIVF